MPELEIGLVDGGRLNFNQSLLKFNVKKKMGHLKTLGIQMGYPIGVLSWVAVKINDQTGFRFILLSWRCQLVLPN